MTLKGKGFFTNDLAACENGDPVAIASAAKAACLNFVVIKIAVESLPVAVDLEGMDILPQIVQGLQAVGVEVWGWHHIRGSDPQAEASVAVERVRLLGLQGYVINAESDFERPGCEPVARQFISMLRESILVPVGLSSYQFPKFHSDFPWSAFLEGCQYHLPKVFWEPAHHAGDQLRESKSQCDSLPSARTYIPVGAAYRTTGWAPLPEDGSDFLNTAHSMGISAVSFFSWDQCKRYIPKVWDTISTHRWPVSSVQVPGPAQDPFSVEFLARLNTRQPAEMAALYDPAAVRTWASETVSGLAAIQDAFAALFRKMPEALHFHLVHSRADNDIHCLTWKAGSLTSETTLVLKNGKIVQDYTFISS